MRNRRNLYVLCSEPRLIALSLALGAEARVGAGDLRSCLPRILVLSLLALLRETQRLMFDPRFFPFPNLQESRSHEKVQLWPCSGEEWPCPANDCHAGGSNDAADHTFSTPFFSLFP
jgi:hypothetical protein